MTKKLIEFAPTVETERRSREIQFLMNIVEPDPLFQAGFVSDEACFLDTCGTDPDEILRRLRFYLGDELTFDLKTPIWRVVDLIKEFRTGWPEN